MLDVAVASVTVTSTVPTMPEGTTALIEPGSLTTTPVAAFAPKATPVTEVKPLPTIVTLLPPAGSPAFGVTLDTTGTSA